MAQSPRKKETHIVRISILGLVLLMGIITNYLIPSLLIAGTGYSVYYLATRKTSLERKNASLRLQDLKDNIQEADHQLERLDDYFEEKKYQQYTNLARQLLPQIEEIRTEADNLKDKIDLQLYKKIREKTENLSTDINEQLNRLNIISINPSTSDKEIDIQKDAPEIAQAYQNIQRDHIEVLDKIQQAANHAELLALHEINMNRFKDILDGYLKIKASPKDFYNAEERLEQAKQAIHQFDLDLDETLRKLNEGHLNDFDISLRMMEKKVQQHEAIADTEHFKN